MKSSREILSRTLSRSAGTLKLYSRAANVDERDEAKDARPEWRHVSAPVNLAKVKHLELTSSRTGEAHALSAVVSNMLGVARSLFVHHDIIPPGRRASGRHFHTERDEVVIVLEGEVTYVHAGVRRRARRGDAIGFPRGEDYAHAIENRSKKRAVVLVVANAAPGDVTIHVDADHASPKGRNGGKVPTRRKAGVSLRSGKTSRAR